MQPISTNGFSNLWRLHDEIQANVRSLENLEVDGTTYGVVLTPLVLRQLPTHIRLEWARVGEGQEGNLTFHDEIQANVGTWRTLRWMELHTVWCSHLCCYASYLPTFVLSGRG
ncbi:hypothetical protein RRG08_042148 [Elysia crispata]|uniref:Uncharacterized protein n=1 Tax=Elysia crispata TaxID=231223 RepID=A0AAE1B8F8_9GAST|nr:hypothetical protein RRG08_042148 [Elysia crispata]